MKKRIVEQTACNKPLGNREDALNSLGKIFPEGLTAKVESSTKGLEYAYTSKIPPVVLETKSGDVRKSAVEVESNQERDERVLHGLFSKTI